MICVFSSRTTIVVDLQSVVSSQIDRSGPFPPIQAQTVAQERASRHQVAV